MLTQQQIIEARKKYNISPSNLSGISLNNNTLIKDKTSPTSNISTSNDTAVNLLKGAAKGAISTFTGISSLGEKMLNKPLELTGLSKPLKQTSAEKLIPESYRTPEGTAQKIGFFGEQLGELMLPTGQTKVVTAIDDLLKLNKLGKIAVKSTVSGAEFGGKTLLQTGDIKEAGKATAIGTISTPVVDGLIKIAEKSTPVIGNIVASVLGKFIGKEPDVIIKAFNNPETVAKAMAKNKIPLDVRNDAIKELSNYEKNIKGLFSSNLENLQSKVPSYVKSGGLSRSLDVSKAKKMVKDSINDSTKGLPDIFRKYRISVVNGNLNFDKLNSSIVSKGEQTAIQKAYNTIKKQTDFTPQGVQDVAARIRALTNFIEGDKGVTSAVVSSIESAYNNAIKNSYPSLGSARNQYAASMKIIQGISDVIKSNKNDSINPTAATSAIKKLSNVFKEDNEAYILALKKLEEISGKDFISELAATEFRNIVPGSFGSRLAEGGLLAGGLVYNPMLLAVLPLFSPKLVGKSTVLAGKASKLLSPSVKNITKVLPKTISGTTVLKLRE